MLVSAIFFFFCFLGVGRFKAAFLLLGASRCVPVSERFFYLFFAAPGFLLAAFAFFFFVLFFFFFFFFFFSFVFSFSCFFLLVRLLLPRFGPRQRIQIAIPKMSGVRAGCVAQFSPLELQKIRVITFLGTKCVSQFSFVFGFWVYAGARERRFFICFFGFFFFFFFFFSFFFSFSFFFFSLFLFIALSLVCSAAFAQIWTDTSCHSKAVGCTRGVCGAIFAFGIAKK